MPRRSGNNWLLLVLIDVVVRIAHALNLFGVFVRDFDAELFFETHYQLDRVERIRAEVVDESRIGRYFVFIDPKFVNNDLFYFSFDLWIGHSFAPLCATKLQFAGLSKDFSSI